MTTTIIIYLTAAALAFFAGYQFGKAAGIRRAWDEFTKDDPYDN